MADRARIRPAQPDDVELIFDLVCQLAEHVHARERVVGNPELLSDALFGPDPAAEALIAEVEGDRVGCAVFFRTFSTWECRPGIWLEDLYVADTHRRAGVGSLLLDAVVDLARRRGYHRVEWSVRNFNTGALEFYAHHGAQRLDDSLILRLDGESLRRFRAQTSS